MPYLCTVRSVPSSSNTSSNEPIIVLTLTNAISNVMGLLTVAFAALASTCGKESGMTPNLAKAFGTHVI